MAYPVCFKFPLFNKTLFKRLDYGQNCKNRLEKEYAVLGKLTYAKLNGRSDNTEDIDASLKRISELRALKKELEIAIEDAKAEKEAQKKAENVANGIK